MKKSRFTDSQIIEAPRAQRLVLLCQSCAELGISNATFYKWRAKLEAWMHR